MKNKQLINALFVFTFFIARSQTQILQRYPKNQIPYKGGYVGYYKDFHDIVIDKGLKPCANTQEFYQFSILVTPDAKVKFIKDFNEKGIQENKCAYNLARKVAKHQTDWIPATIDGVKQNAIANFVIYPDDIFNRYAAGYLPALTLPVYNNKKEKNMEYFWKELRNNFDLKRFNWNNTFSVDVDFTITKEGKLEDIFLSKPTGLAEFDKMIDYGFKRMKKKWDPATINAMPVDYRIRYTINGVTDPAD